MTLAVDKHCTRTPRLISCVRFDFNDIGPHIGQYLCTKRSKIRRDRSNTYAIEWPGLPSQVRQALGFKALQLRL